MYTKHFGLIMLPFENVPDPRFFFDHGEHAKVRNKITESFKAGRGLTIVTGPIGSGKTTLSQMVISDFTDNIKLVWMAEPPVSGMDLFLFIAQELGLQSQSSERVFILRDIKDALIKLNGEGSKCLLVIDESHLMAADVLDGIRMLNNLEVGSTKLIQILLLGQEELMKTINKPEMEAFRQRIATLEMLGKMNADRIRKYVSYRIQVAGGSLSLMADTGWEAIALAFGAGSTPRVINSLCDKSFTTAFEREKNIVDVDDVYEAALGMGLQKDIFFYKVALKKGENQVQSSSADVRVPVTGPEVSGNGVHSSGKGPADNIERISIQPGTPQAKQNIFNIDLSLSKKEHKGQKVPALVLALSIAALILSVFFYCERSGSTEAMTCLLELIGF
ncbi:MAG: AAA family ATPase [Nitrospirae bacterium]|nr:AAA family ATPase [Nitrospirota bacterium]